jgi:hypothetical protein
MSKSKLREKLRKELDLQDLPTVTKQERK